MMRYLYIIGLCLCCTACGPKDVGEGTASTDYGTNPAVEPEAQLRYPISGSPTQQRLYLFNQPQTFTTFQQRQRNFMQRHNGNTPNDYTNLTPQQVSPFRQ